MGTTISKQKTSLFSPGKCTTHAFLKIVFLESRCLSKTKNPGKIKNSTEGVLYSLDEALDGLETELEGVDERSVLPPPDIDDECAMEFMFTGGVDDSYCLNIHNTSPKGFTIYDSGKR